MTEADSRRSAEVDAFLAETAHPLGATIELLRTLLLELDGVTESVKWNAPNYALADDFATMSLRRPGAVQLILHTGAKAKPGHPEIVIDPLPTFAKWAGRNRAVLTFTGDADAHGRREELAAMIASWIAQFVADS